MVKSNFDDNNLFTVNISPISSKQEYSCLCEVVEEYGGNLDYLMSKNRSGNQEKHSFISGLFEC